MSGADSAKTSNNDPIKNPEDFFEVGIGAGPWGLKGDIKVFPTTDDPGRFRLLKELYGEQTGGLVRYTIESMRFHKNLVILKFCGIDSVEAARAMGGRSFKIPPELALPLEEDQYYHRDLIDMQVYEADEQSEVIDRLGVLTRIISTGANDVYGVKTEAGTEILIPAIKRCVLKVEVPEKRMTVRLIKGLR